MKNVIYVAVGTLYYITLMINQYSFFFFWIFILGKLNRMKNNINQTSSYNHLSIELKKI